MAASATLHQSVRASESSRAYGHHAESSRVHGGGLAGRLLQETAGNCKARSSAVTASLKCDAVAAAPAGAAPADSAPAPETDKSMTFRAAENSKGSDVGTSGDLGLPRNLLSIYDIGDTIGKGGHGHVRLATHKATSEVFACKTMAKRLDGDGRSISDLKVQRRLASLRNEVEVMRRLRGTLNVAHLEEAFEDDESVHLVMEHCSGGELLHTLGQKHYSEDTVSSVMRAVLRTLAQCHSHRVLHLDVKQENFLLLNSSEKAPLKAIDFGLARTFRPEELPLDDVGVEGTPWFMAPEMLRSQVTPACDIWAAGVMAFQLLSGDFPFNDKQNPMRPKVKNIWKSILTDKLKFDKSYWEGISDEAKDFVETVLNRDPSQRPTAKELLRHPWLTSSTVEDRFSSKKKGLKAEVVQRIQRYGQSGLGRRSLLESLVEEMLQAPMDSTMAAAACPATGEVAMPECNAALGVLKKHLERSGDGQEIDYATMARMLRSLGYRLEESEIEHLMHVMDIGHSGNVSLSQFLASQMDWAALERNHREIFEEAAQRAFSNLDSDGDGLVSPDELCSALRAKIPSSDVPYAVEEVLSDVEERECARSCGSKLDIDGFLALLHFPSNDSLSTLDQYDSKLSRSGSSGSSLSSILAGLDRSLRDGSLHSSDEWLELEKTVKDRNLLHNTEEWKRLEESVKGAHTATNAAVLCDEGERHHASGHP